MNQSNVMPGELADASSIHETLAQTGLLQGAEPVAVTALAKTMRSTTFARGHTVFRQGEPGNEMFVIVSGKVKVNRAVADGRESLLAILGPSDIFGELALFDPGPRTSTVITLTTVKARCIERESLLEWMADRPEIAQQLLQVLARRLRRTNNNLADLIFTDVPGRVAKQLLALAERFGTHDRNGLRVQHELTQEEIAQLVGSSRETVNKALIEFTRRGWIRTTGKTTWIRDSGSLARRAR